MEVDHRDKIVSGSFRQETSSPSESSLSPSQSRDINSHDGQDLEKATTSPDLYPSCSSGRVSRIQSLTRRRKTFTHPLSHVKTKEDVLVDFDGPDDPYGPLNWPFRKKVVTTVLYAFTTMGSTWASSV